MVDPEEIFRHINYELNWLNPSYMAQKYELPVGRILEYCSAELADSWNVNCQIRHWKMTECVRK